MAVINPANESGRTDVMNTWRALTLNYFINLHVASIVEAARLKEETCRGQWGQGPANSRD